MTTTETDPNVLIPAPSHADSPPKIVDIGPDGEWLVGYGHVDGFVFTVLAIAHVAELFGIRQARDMLDHDIDTWTEVVHHRWAVELERDGEPFIQWGDVTKDTPDAFPVTMLNQDG